MKKNESNKQPSLKFNEKGAGEVNKQILNSYNSGYINKQGQHADLKH